MFCQIIEHTFYTRLQPVDAGLLCLGRQELDVLPRQFGEPSLVTGLVKTGLWYLAYYAQRTLTAHRRRPAITSTERSWPSSLTLTSGETWWPSRPTEVQTWLRRFGRTSDWTVLHTNEHSEMIVWRLGREIVFWCSPESSTWHASTQDLKNSARTL